MNHRVETLTIFSYVCVLYTCKGIGLQFNTQNEFIGDIEEKKPVSSGHSDNFILSCHILV